ncbi:MAG: cyclic nucleotide-binding domain-containing protein [Bacteroidota bacterium]
MIQTSLIGKLSLQWDLRLGPYRAFFAQSEREIRNCVQTIGLEKGRMGQVQQNEVSRQFAICEDTRTNEVVACLYLCDVVELNEDLSKKEAYNLSFFKEEWLSEIAALSPVYFRTNEEKTLISQVLISHCFIEILKARGQALIIPCDIGFFSIYKRFGLRPIGSLRNDLGDGHSIPMILLPDWEYLSLIHSPILDLFQSRHFPPYQDICEWYYQLVRKNSELQIGSAFYPEQQEDFEKHRALTEGLSPKGLERFLDSAMVVKCREGEVLISENDAGKAIGYIEKGIVHVVIGGKTVVLLSEGDIFGEIAFILNTKRSAQVIAAGPDTEIVLFSSKTIESLNEGDKMIVWRNLSRVLAQRLVLTNRLLG